MAGKGLVVRWIAANAIGMSLGFLAFIQTLMFLTFGFDFGLHWSSELVENLEEAEAERLLRIGLIVGLPLAGTILTSCQALILRGLLPQVRTWILAGPLGFAAIILLIWPFTAIWGDLPGPVEPFTIVGGGLLVTGILQWLFLRRRDIAATRWLVLWFAGLPLGMVVFMGIYTVVDLMASVSWAAEIALIGFAIGGTAAAISGKPLFRAISSRVVSAALVLLAAPAAAQERLPILDMHLHALAADAQGPPPLAMCTPIEPLPAWDPAAPYGETFIAMFKTPPCPDPVWSPMTDAEVMTQTLEVMERRNVIGVLSGPSERMAAWRAAAPERFIPGLLFPLGDATPSADSLRRLHERGDLAVLGEVTNQYAGIPPDDDRMAPYWALAEELDIPVGIHVGTGPPGVIYLGAGGYRARLHSALTMEEVLVRHPRLRVYIMHAGYPMLDDLLALMYAHPQVYVDVGVIVYTQPRAAFYRYLRGIFEGGFGNRVMFGSDQMVWPGTIERAIAVIEEAPFLNAEQKRALLYDNAARFLRLSEDEIARHHRM